MGYLTGVDAATVRRWLEGSAAALHEQRDYLTQLDAAIGDADHGTNMDRGFSSVVAKLAELDGTEAPGRILVTAGSTLVSTIGGASGPLWGTALRRAGRSLGDGATFEGAALAVALEAALDGVVELGAAQPGDKTMVDAFEPAVRTLKQELVAGKPTAEALASAHAAAEEGMQSTVPLQASKGRASYLGERSIGHQDPGATSTAIILRALEQAVAAPGGGGPEAALEALARAAAELARTEARLAEQGLDTEAEILAASRLMAEDPSLGREVEALAAGLPAAEALRVATERHAA